MKRTRAGGTRRDPAAVHRADHAEGLSGPIWRRSCPGRLLTPQTVGVIIIRNLERDGAIRRTPHPVHGRILQWTLTPRGLGLLEQCRRHAMALERRLGAGMTTSEIATIRRWLSKIAGDLQEN